MQTDPLEALDREVTDAHIGAVRAFMAERHLAAADVRLVGLHGQTVYHRPQERYTRQLGIGGDVAKTLGIDTVSRFRHADVASGGEGAPFAPLYHRALAHGLGKPVMVLNLGGVGNVTYLDGDDVVIAFDTGPASALLDDFVLRRRGLPTTPTARSPPPAASIRASSRLMDNPYFAGRRRNRSTARIFTPRAGRRNAALDADGAATLAAFTVAIRRRRAAPRAAAAGALAGHRRRPAQRAFHAPAAPRGSACRSSRSRAVGWDGDYLEAQCFAYLAVRSARGLPLSLPTTTGVPKPMPGGELHRAA